MKNKPKDKPSGRHPFDRLCAKRGIQHRLTRPYRPQTNGLVERFNRRIVDAIGREPKRGSARRLFRSHQDRDAFLNRFVADYNRTRLKCLGYHAPLEALANLPGPNTFARDDGGERWSFLTSPRLRGEVGDSAIAMSPGEGVPDPQRSRPVERALTPTL